jgi:hypothetical protein
MGVMSMIDLMNEPMLVRRSLKGLRCFPLELRNRTIHGSNHPCLHLILAHLTNRRLRAAWSLWC